MGRNTGAARYATGMATNPYSLKNMYIYGGTVWTFIMVGMGLMVTGNIEEALIYLVENYILMLLPLQWPLNEILAAETLSEFIVSHIITIGTGLLVATFKYWLNPGY